MTTHDLILESVYLPNEWRIFLVSSGSTLSGTLVKHFAYLPHSNELVVNE